MAASSDTKAGRLHPEGYWGKWRGVSCSADGCDLPAKCNGFCNSHYNKAKWAAGYFPPSRNARSQRGIHLRYRYGIDHDDYERLLRDQGGVCAVCGDPPTPANTRQKGVLFVDHDHDTGSVRGLLCNECNLMVGFGRTPARLAAAARYVSAHS